MKDISNVILVIDDSVHNIKVVVDYLKESGFETAVARNGKMGIKRSELLQPSLILLDVLMPEMDGFETCRQLKSREATKDIPVIFMTALDSIEDKVQAFASGGVDYIAKPAQKEEVLARVRTHVKLRQQAQELEAARQIAEQANTAKSKFLTNMSHELRTPLNAILGFSQLVCHDQSLAPLHREQVAIIHRSGEHLLTLINDVLDMSKIEAGRTTVKNKAFDLYQLFDDLQDMFSLKAHTKGLTLLLEKTYDVPQFIIADEIKLRQVLINLIGNAVKFTQGGRVAVAVSGKQKVEGRKRKADSESENAPIDLFFEVSDSGPGIPPEELPHLFQPFAQTQIGQETSEGTGLGLAISQKFVRIMGGELTVESHVGCGSVFKFKLAVEQTAGADKKHQSSSSVVIGLKTDQPTYRILAVDDRYDNREFLRQLLTPLGFELREARDGQEAVHIWKAWKPHLIWMDVRMPGMTGYEAAQKIRKAENAEQKTTSQRQSSTTHPSTKIIALSASSLDDEKGEALEMGCDDFLRKPYRESDLFALMTRHLGVQYVYEQVLAHQHTSTPVSQLTPDVLATLPELILERLTKVTMLADMALIEETIEETRIINAVAADELSTLAHDFEYGTILRMLQQVKEKKEHYA